MFYIFQKVCRDALCYSGLSPTDGSCQNEEVCYEMYVTVSVITELRPSVDAIQNGQYIGNLLFQINKHIPHFEGYVLQMKVFYHADGFNLVDYFLLYLIVDGAYEQVRGENKKQLFLHNKTIMLEPRGIETDEIHDYILRIESYNITVLEETAFLYVPSLSGANSSDLLHAVKFTNMSSCIRQQVVPFNKVRICPYFEISLTTFAFSVSNGHIIFVETSANPKPKLKLLPWEYMIKEDHVLICITDFSRLHSLLSVQVSNGASLLLKRDECCCCIFIILAFCLYKGLAPFSF